MDNLSNNMDNFSNKLDNKDLQELTDKKLTESELTEAQIKLENKVIEGENNNIPFTWNPNNTLESMQTNNCLVNVPNVNRIRCHSAPQWWYPSNKYNAVNFKSKIYLDRHNKIYNHLGNVQDMFWDFKSVKGEFST